ncbi:MAG: hypothetical protein JW741_28520 [Sedimentisphaerales bacterium]|nr:hypothetical protein [Sedimentisphaerales bacterium]
MAAKPTNVLSFVLLLTVCVGVGEAGSLVGYWSFDEGPDAIVPDLSGSGNDGIVNGTPAWIDGPFGSALELDGTADFVDCGNSESLNLTEAVSVSAWVRTVDAGESGEQLGGQNHYISKYDSYGIKHRTNLLIFWVYDGGWYATRISIDNSFNGEWHHVVGTYDGKILKTYVDGSMEGDLAHEGSIALNALNVLIGNNPASETEKLHGAIDEAYIYSRALSDAHVQELLAGVAPSFQRAEAPDPADGARGVLNPLLQWTPGEDAVLHKLYVGTSPELSEAEYQGQLQTALYWYAAGLAPGETYYWRVDEVLGDGTTTTGHVWSFTSASPQAYDPRPHDGDDWVDPNGVTLRWEAGTNAQSHELCFGTDRAAVEAGNANAYVIFQPMNSYEFVALEKDTTYYWRVDEHSSGGGTTPGAVWTFTTAGGPYEGVKAEYFANADLLGAPAVVRSESRIDFLWPDGDVEGTNSPAEGIPTNDYSARWSAELHVVHSGEYRFVINVNNSGRLWLDGKVLIDRWPNDGAIPEYTTKRVSLEAGRVYSLVMEWNKYNPTGLARLEWIDPFGDRSVIPPGHLQLPLRANQPTPGAGQEDVTHEIELAWHSGYQAAQHDVYFGTDGDAVAAADPATGGIYRGRQDLEDVTFDPGTLDWATTYYWRVDEVNTAEADSPWRGHVWSFTTADFLVVDDFESYSNEVGERPFEVWVDGFGFSLPEPGDPGNGSNAMVGHDVWSPSSPYYNGLIMETSIVYTGRQSLPVDYNNVKTPYYSEIERTWKVPQDWTVNDVAVLTLHFRAAAGNTGDDFYVGLEDGAGNVGVVTHPDPNAMLATQWTEWQIPLSEFGDAGVNVAAVKKMVIGLGDRDAPVPGGAGSFYLDDIRVTRPEEAVLEPPDESKL